MLRPEMPRTGPPAAIHGRGAAVALGFEVEIEVHKWQNAFLVVVMPAGRVEGTGEDLA